MTEKAGDFFPAGINQYSPAMQYAAGVHIGGISEFSLGTPSLADDDGIHADIDADGAAATILASAFVAGTGGIGAIADSPYGRNITLSISGDPGAAFTATITSEDYLGQIMTETLVVANGQTADTIGDKAHFKVLKIVHDGGASNAVLCDVGWGSKLGLPYKMGKLSHARENSIYIAPNEELIRVGPQSVTISGANAATFTVPRDGWVIGFEAEITTASTIADSLMDVIVGGVGVAGLDFSIGWGSSDENIGAKYGNLVAPGLANADAIAGETVTATSNGGATAGVADITMLMSPAYGQFSRPDETDPATATTKDTRGTYTPFTTMDGTLEIIVYFVADNAVNSSGNGGLHGIAQV